MTKHESHRTYGEWKPGMKTDLGKPLKKRGRKKGTRLLIQTEAELEVGKIINYMTFGKSKIENEDNIELKVKANTPLTIRQACNEYGININTFYSHLRAFPAIKLKYEELKVDRREYLKEVAENTMVTVLEDGNLTDKEKFDASFKIAQATMKEYNPKTEIESRSIGINLSKTSDDLRNDLAELLGLNN